MRKLFLFFTKSLVSGVLALIGTLELLWSIPSKYFTTKVEIWIILLIALLILLTVLLWKRIRICYYVRSYTTRASASKSIKIHLNPYFFSSVVKYSESMEALTSFLRVLSPSFVAFTICNTNFLIRDRFWAALSRRARQSSSLRVTSRCQ